MPTTPPMDSFPRQQGDAATRLILSASAASSPERLSKSLQRMFDRAGSVTSGLAPRPLDPLSPSGSEPEHLPWSPLNLSRPPAAAADIDTLGRTIERVRNRLGCPHCCSGFDRTFQRELEAFARTTNREPGDSTP